jgi:hypothetical protein
MAGPMPVRGRPRPRFGVSAIDLPRISVHRYSTSRGKAATLRPALTSERLLGGEGWLLPTLIRRAARC